MLTDIPKYLGGAKTLYIAESAKKFASVFRNEIEVPIRYISDCQPEDDEEFLSFGFRQRF